MDQNTITEITLDFSKALSKLGKAEKGNECNMVSISSEGPGLVQIIKPYKKEIEWRLQKNEPSGSGASVTYYYDRLPPIHDVIQLIDFPVKSIELWEGIHLKQIFLDIE